MTDFQKISSKDHSKPLLPLSGRWRSGGGTDSAPKWPQGHRVPPQRGSHSAPDPGHSENQGAGWTRTGEWARGAACAEPGGPAAASGVRPPAGTEDGGGASPDSTCLSGGFREPSRKWIPGTLTPQRRRAEDTPPTPGLRQEQARPSKALIRPGVNPGLSQDWEVRRQQQTHTVQSRPPPSRCERKWKQTPHKWPNPGWAGLLIPHRGVSSSQSNSAHGQSLQPDEPPTSTAHPPAEGLEESGTGKALERSGQAGQLQEGPLPSRTALVCQRRAKTTPYAPSPPAHSAPLPSTTKGSCLNFPEQDVPSTDRGAGPLSHTDLGLVRPWLGGGRGVPVQAGGGPRGSGSNVGARAAPGLPRRLPSSACAERAWRPAYCSRAWSPSCL